MITIDGREYLAVASQWGGGGTLCEPALAEKKLNEIRVLIERYADAGELTPELASDFAEAEIALTDTDAGERAFRRDADAGHGDHWNVAHSLDELGWLDPVDIIFGGGETTDDNA